MRKVRVATIAAVRLVAALAILLSGLYGALVLSLNDLGGAQSYLWLALAILLPLGAVAGAVAGRWLIAPALLLLAWGWEYCFGTGKTLVKLARGIENDWVRLIGADLGLGALCAALLVGGIALGYRASQQLWPALPARA